MKPNIEGGLAAFNQGVGLRHFVKSSISPYRIAENRDRKSGIPDSYSEVPVLNQGHKIRSQYLEVECKEVKKHIKFISVIMLLTERHVSAYSEAIIRFNNFQLYDNNIFHGSGLIDVESHVVGNC